MRQLAVLMAMALVLNCVLAAQQVATITAPGPFTLKGAKVDPKGVPSWPLNAGDEIATGDTGLTIHFPDGSKITLQPHSKAIIEMQGGAPLFRLQDCGAYFEMKPASSVKLYAKENPLKPSDATGKYSIGCTIPPAAAPAAAGGFWTAKTVAILVASGAGAGIAAGFAVAGNDGTPVSARQ